MVKEEMCILKQSGMHFAGKITGPELGRNQDKLM